MRKSNFDLIEKYIMGDLSAEENTAFEKMMEMDSKLKVEYILRRDINDAILESDIMKLRHNLSEMMNKKNKKALIINPFILSAIAAVFILAMVIKTLFSGSLLDNNEYFETYYSVYPSVYNSRSNNELFHDQLSIRIAFDKYDKSDFESAGLLFKEITDNDSTNIMAKFYLSIVFIEQNKLSDAERYLNELVSNKHHLFYEQSVWYLALVYLKENKSEEAKELLSEIISGNFSYKPQAKKILKSLN